MAKKSPSSNRKDDPFKRGDRGKFAKGNCGGPGNPNWGLVQDLRRRFFTRVKKSGGVRRAAQALAEAIDGKQLTPSQIIAIRELLDRSGCSAASMVDERKVEVEEQALEKLTDLEDQLDG